MNKRILAKNGKGHSQIVIAQIDSQCSLVIA